MGLDNRGLRSTLNTKIRPTIRLVHEDYPIPIHCYDYIGPRLHKDSNSNKFKFIYRFFVKKLTQFKSQKYLKLSLFTISGFLKTNKPRGFKWVWITLNKSQDRIKNDTMYRSSI